MKTFLIMIGIGLAVFCYNGAVTAAEREAGFVQNVSGQSYIVRNSVTLPAKVKDKLMEKDILLTGKNGSMGIIMKDNSVMSIGSNTRLAISKFHFERADEKSSFIAQIKKGTVVYMSGLLAKINVRGISFQTPTAVCGLRGTKLAIKVESPEDQEGPILGWIMDQFMFWTDPSCNGHGE